MRNPFIDKTGNILFPYKAIRDVVFVLPCKTPEQLGFLILPETYRENYRNEYGIVLSIGPGAYIKKFKKYVQTIVKAGDLVVYDPATPWTVNVEAPDCNSYLIKIMGERDISGKIQQ